MATIDIIEAWTMAEQAVFAKLLEATDATEGQDGFLGAIGPGNSWSLFVGGGSADGPRNQCYSVLHLSARIIARYYERSDCIVWAGKVLGMLADTTNLKDLSGSNVAWFRLLEYPGEPEEAADADGDRLFIQTIPCELIASTTATNA